MPVTFPRELGVQIARIAEGAVRERLPNVGHSPPFSSGGDAFETVFVNAPAKLSVVSLGPAPLVAGTLELTRVADGHLFLPFVDYEEAGTGFRNLRIAPGTPLEARFFREELAALGHAIFQGDAAAPLPQRDKLRIRGGIVRAYDDADAEETVLVAEPANDAPEPFYSPPLLNSWSATGAPHAPPGYYRDRDRVFLRGRVGGGTAGDLFVLPAGYRPNYEETPLANADGGPVPLSVAPGGGVSVATAPAWVSLDGIGFRALTGHGARYPNTNRYPNTDRYPNG